jgi:hypothetical protein
VRKKSKIRIKEVEEEPSPILLILKIKKVPKLNCQSSTKKPECGEIEKEP